MHEPVRSSTEADHDLLIRISEQVSHILTAITKLEATLSTKVDQREFTELKERVRVVEVDVVAAKGNWKLICGITAAATFIFQIGLKFFAK